MRFVDRSLHPVPATLTVPGSKGHKELAGARDWFGDRSPDAKKPSFAAYKDDEVKLRLEAMFHGKCAYCETRYAHTAPMDVEHHRPKAQVAEDPGHPGYWWLAMAWANLLPSCIDCNRQRRQVLVEIGSDLVRLAAASRPATSLAGKKDSFPLADGGIRATAEAAALDDEKPLLIDPCRDRPFEHIAFSIEAGLPLGLAIPVGDETQKLRGAVSIQVYGLNRLHLVQERTRVLRHLAFLGDFVFELSKAIDDLLETIGPGPSPGAAESRRKANVRRTAHRLSVLRGRTLSEIKQMTADEAPYSAMTKAWLTDFADRVRPSLPAGEAA